MVFEKGNIPWVKGKTIMECPSLRGHIWTEEEIEYLKQNYSLTINSVIMKKLNLNEGQIVYRARCLGLKKSEKLLFELRSKNGKKVFKKYGISPNCTNRIPVKNVFKENTPESMWILGLLASDGWLQYHRLTHDRKIGFSGNLNTIKKVVRILDSKHKIEKVLKGTYRFMFGDIEIYNYLLKLGFYPNKSLTLRYPKIPRDRESTKHFIRGVFDGDGCVSLLTDNRRRLGVQKTKFLRSFICSGSESFLKDIKEILELYGIKSTNVKFNKGSLKSSIVNKSKTKGVYKLHFTHHNSLTFYDFIYRDVPEGIMNEIKFNKFNELIVKCKKSSKNRYLLLTRL